MRFRDVRRQLEEVYTRAILSGISARQHNPSIVDPVRIGDLGSTAFSLKNIPYAQVYSELDRHNRYHLKLIDGALLQFQYSFDEVGLTKHRLAYFPTPELPTVEEAPELYENDELYGDMIVHRLVRFPIRFDFDPANYSPTFHPHAHLTLGQFENCRIPASHPLSPNIFFLFLLRNFYFRIYRKNQNIFDKHISSCSTTRCITDHELRITSIGIGKT